ncbi:MAG: hypothetical protein AMXMBFR13_34590 [Phycisphaerae bacterium]
MVTTMAQELTYQEIVRQTGVEYPNLRALLVKAGIKGRKLNQRMALYPPDTPARIKALLQRKEVTRG